MINGFFFFVFASVCLESILTPPIPHYFSVFSFLFLSSLVLFIFWNEKYSLPCRSSGANSGVNVIYDGVTIGP